MDARSSIGSLSNWQFSPVKPFLHIHLLLASQVPLFTHGQTVRKVKRIV